MTAGNHSAVSDFVLLGFCQSWNAQVLLFVVFLLLYLITVSGNVVIVILVITEPRLHSPMYFFLANLSFVDMWLSTNTTPKMITDFLRKHKTISFAGCMSQIFFSHFIGALEMVILVIMAYDRYVAICKPLRYSVIMSFQRCIVLVGTAWIIGFVHAISQTALIVQLPFCGPREVGSFFCDRPLVMRLVCMDYSTLNILLNLDCGVVAVTCFILLLISYSHILVTVSRSSKAGASKALSTCSAHITVVVLFFGPCIFIYVWPLNITWMDKFLAVFYSAFTPVLNPAIYTLRNKDMKTALKTLSSYCVDFKRNT
ncbi:olfactory receptor 4K3-like [Nannospalax galili]|uniref:olfactory receptor 4K3-like n=1 Tax=Nannospalax galili TaxID=1026970 RepID=UPI0004ED606B|nr:olfactory receptor 4K3-like [Nannospalax galili]